MKYSFRKLLRAFAAGTVFSLAISAAAQADLIGYWPFDSAEEVDGELVTVDASPNENNGVLNGDASIAEDAERGAVLDLGDFNNSAFVSIPAAGDGVFDSVVETQKATISFWMNRLEQPSGNQWTWIFDGGSESSDPVGGRQLASHAGWGGGDGTLYFDTGGCCGGNQRINKAMVTDDGVAFGQDGEWHHLAYVRDEDDTFVYVDGTLFHSSIEQTGEDAITSPIAPILQATIGANANGGGSQAGLLDDFAIWDEALSVDRIMGLASGGGVIPIPEGETIGDFNSDGAIDLLDFNILAENFNGQFSLEDAFFKGDMDGNLRINLRDFHEFRALFQAQAAGGAAAAVPEPACSLLLALGSLLGTLLVRRQR